MIHFPSFRAVRRTIQCAVIALALWGAAPACRAQTPDTTQTAPEKPRVVAGPTGDAMFTYVRGLEHKKHDERRAYITDRLREWGIPFISMPFDTVISYNSRQKQYHGENIIVRMGEGTGKVVIGAHFDAVYSSPGANDNASGTAVLLQMIHDLKDQKFKHVIDFCFFDLEEAGLLGSAFYVKRYDTSVRHLGMINVDVAGTGEEVFIAPVTTGPDSLLLHFVHVAEDSLQYEYYEDNWCAESDHESFRDAKMQNIAISVVPVGDGRRLAHWAHAKNSSLSSATDEDLPYILRVMHTKDDASTLVTPEALTIGYNFVKCTLLQLDFYTR